MSPMPHIVVIALTGTSQDVTFWLDLLDDIATLTNLSDPYQARDGRITIRATVSRTVPLTGGMR